MGWVSNTNGASDTHGLVIPMIIGITKMNYVLTIVGTNSS